MSSFRKGLAGLVLGGVLAMQGCKSADFHENSRDIGEVKYVGTKGIESIDLILTVCNDGILLGYEGWPTKYPVIKYINKKNSFVEGEPIEFWLESTSHHGLGRTGLYVELRHNGNVLPERGFSTQINPQFFWVPYLGLKSGNYTSSCYSLNEFVGKIDFEVVANPLAVSANK